MGSEAGSCVGRTLAVTRPSAVFSAWQINLKGWPAARAAGLPYKLICQAEKTADGRVTASVRPTQLPAADPIANVNGPDSIVTFEMDTLYSLTVSEQRPDALTTAYGPFADFLTIATR